MEVVSIAKKSVVRELELQILLALREQIIHH